MLIEYKNHRFKIYLTYFRSIEDGKEYPITKIFMEDGGDAIADGHHEVTEETMKIIMDKMIEKEAIRKAAIEVINEHPDMDLLPEDLKLPKIKCDGLGKYTRKERK